MKDLIIMTEELSNEISLCQTILKEILKYITNLLDESGHICRWQIEMLRDLVIEFKEKEASYNNKIKKSK